MATAQTTLPHWDMTVVYPGIDSPEFREGFDGVVREIEQLRELFDAHGIGERPPAPLDDETLRTLEIVIERFNAMLERSDTLGAYLYAFVSTDSRDATAQAAMSELQNHSVVLSQLATRFTAWVGSLDVEAAIGRSALAREHAYPLRLAKEQAAHLMSPAEEALAAELRVTGGSAWGKLHGDVTSQISVPLVRDGEAQELPMSMVRALAVEPDREVRRAAYHAELEAWEGVAVPLAAALNSIKGEVNTLSAKRHWGSALDAALFDAHIDRRTLDAMMEAAYESFGFFRRYLKAKARALGLPSLAWYDLLAPVGEGSRRWEYADGARFIEEQFGSFSPRMRGLAARAFEESWIDAEPRPGKRDGAYCMSLRGEESRVFANYKPSYDGVSTLAHELGHAYHNLNEAGRTRLQRDTPMTLAETASIFCETIIREAALQDADEAESLAILEASLQGSCQVVVDITSRFLFESRLFERRRERELSVQELCGLMLDAQKETYGDGLDSDQLHPYMWAVKGHYYSSGLSFYNFPYMFGLLFGLGLYARYREDPEGFKTGYDDLLSSTGLADAATLAQGFGIDIRTPAFWRSSLDVVRADVDRFEELIG